MRLGKWDKGDCNKIEERLHTVNRVCHELKRISQVFCTWCKKNRR